MQEIAEAPAPWRVRGRAYWIMYRFPEAFVREAFAQPGIEILGRTGFVGLVDYAQTNVGTYQELMLLPGRVRLPGGSGYSVSHIVVDSEASMVNGRRNWAIPKGLAQFDWQRTGDGTERVLAWQDGTQMIDITLRPRGPSLPFNSRWLVPSGLSIVQQRADSTLRTAFHARCQLRSARVEACSTIGAVFPAVGAFRPLAAFHQTWFDIDMAPAEALRAKSAARAAR